MKGICKGILWFLFYFLLMALIQQLLVMAGAGAGSMEAMTRYMQAHMLGLAAVSNVLVGLVLLLCFRRAGIKEQWRLQRVPKKGMLYGMALGFSYSLLSGLLTRNVISPAGDMAFQSAASYGSPWGFILLAVNVLVLAPAVEEIALHGIVYTRIRKTAPAWAAVLISGILFGLMHAMAGGAALVINASILGLLMGLLLSRYDSLWICMAAHASANLPAFLLMHADQAPLPVILGLEVLSAAAAVFCLVKVIRD